jgi:cobalt-zinc-cadmium efflux system membrane fusion protein
MKSNRIANANTNSKKMMVLALLLILNLNSCKDKNVEVEHTQFKLTDELLNLIDTDTVRLIDAVNVLNLNGKITFESENIVEIFPMFGGNVTEVRAELGDYVTKGEILAVIRSSEIADFQQEEREAQSNLLVAQRNFEATQDMNKAGLMSDIELQEATAELNNAKAQLDRIKEIFSIYSIRNNSEYAIKAPISGFVVEKNITREMQLRDDRELEIFTISKLDDIWVLASVYERDIGKIKQNNKVEIYVPAYPDMKFETTVDKIYNVLDAESNTLTIRMKLRNDKYLLKPGMFAKVYAYSDDATSEKLPSINEMALIFDKNKYFVVVVNGDDFAIREVEPSNIRTATYISIKNGLRVGERVVTKNALLIYNALQ